MSISLVLLLVLGAAQMALIGYNQVSADGAAFIASHTAAVDPSASPGVVAHNVFNNIAASQVVATPSPGVYQYSVSKSVGGFSLIPGFSSSYTVGGGDVELAPSPPPSTGPSYAIGFTSVLYNYCEPGTTCSFPSAHSMYLAQDIIPGGNGVNGQFQEWGCHEGYFDNLVGDFPSTMPSGITAKSALDMTYKGTDEYEIYSWDTGSSCS